MLHAINTSSGTWEANSKPRVIEDPSKAYAYVSNVTEVEVRSSDDALRFLETGRKNRSVGVV